MKGDTAAFFDVDGTLLQGNIVSYYARLRLLGMEGAKRQLWMAGFLAKIPYYVVLDKLSRRRFATSFYRNYRSMDPSEMREKVGELFREHIEPAIYPEAEATIKRHRKQGHWVVLVTGSLEPIVERVAEKLKVSEVICCRLVEEQGAFTGELAEGPLTDVEKAAAVRNFAAEHGVDLAQCFGYADSMDDVPMLEQVGRPHAVNPKGRLARLARERGWPVLQWELPTPS